MEALKTAKNEACEVASGIPLTGGEAPVESKQDYITRILAEHPVDGHLFSLQANYIVCQKCSARVLKNSAREKIQQLHEGPCWYGPWQPHPRWTGSPTHNLWRKGNKVYCQHCNGHALQKGEEWQASRPLQRPCSRSVNRQTTLPLVFRPKRPSEEAD